MVRVGQEWEMYYPDLAPLRFFLRRTKERYVMRCYSPELRSELCRAVLHTPVLVDAGSKELVEFMSAFIKKSLSAAKKLAGKSGPGDPELTAAYPALAEFLTLTVDENKPRQTATLTVFYQDNVFKAFLNDRESDSSLCVMAPSFSALWGELEAALTSDCPGWRRRDENGQMTRRKRS